MKLSIILITLVFTSVLIFLQNDNGNLLVNGDFEQSKNGILPDNWNGDTHIYSLSTEPYSGKYSLKYINSDSSLYKLCTQTLNVKPGMNYSAGVRIKTSNISGSDFGASFCVEWQDENGRWLGGAYPKGIKGTNNWTQVSGIVSIPNDAKKVTFSCYVRKGMTGTAWFDDAFIIPILNDKINILMLRPVYRGLLFNDGNQQIILSAELNPAAINKDDSYISTVIYNSSGNKLITDSIDITGGKEYHTISINAANLQEGNYLLNASLIDKNGASVYSWSSKIKKIERANQPAVCFDDHKRLLVNGKKVFPLGMYWGSIDEADLNIYAESKFNFLLAYSRPTGEQMNMAEKSNMKVVYSVKDYYAGSPYAPAEIKSSGDETILLKKTLEEFKDSPSLLAWYINDEYSPDYINRLNEHYTLITDEDPNHPVLSIILHPFQTNLYLHSTDVIGNDPYVVPNSPLYKVGEATKTVVNQTNDSRPVWMVIQAHNIGNYKEFIPNPQDYRTPTYDEMRSMSWQAICNGADGLIYYSYFDLKRNPDVPFEIQWSNLKRIVTEIDTFSNALLSDNKADSIRINSGDGDNTWFNWTTRNFNNRLYIFVVANGKNEGKIEFNIPGKYKSIRRINENPQELKLINSKFSDTIKNMDVRIYSAD